MIRSKIHILEAQALAQAIDVSAAAESRQHRVRHGGRGGTTHVAQHLVKRAVPLDYEYDVPDFRWYCTPVPWQRLKTASTHHEFGVMRQRAGRRQRVDG